MLSSSRETETFESVSEDDQLPQVVHELHDVHVSPGSPIAKLELKVRGKMNRSCHSFDIKLAFHTEGKSMKRQQNLLLPSFFRCS